MSLHPSANASLAYLPPDLREVCDILARGLLRLRSRDAEEAARDAAQAGGSGDIRLPFTAHQRLHANPRRKGLA
jgi:hypothetical protein